MNEFENRFRLHSRNTVISDHASLAGQTIINVMLEECYKITRKMIMQEPEIDQNLFYIKEELEQALTELDMILLTTLKDKSVDLNHLESLQNTLDTIDSQQKDGKFFDENGNIPKGQAYIRFILEASYDRVNDILVNLEMEDGEEQYPESLKEL